VELIKIITHKYAIGEENGMPLYICRKPKNGGKIMKIIYLTERKMHYFNLRENRVKSA